MRNHNLLYIKVTLTIVLNGIPSQTRTKQTLIHIVYHLWNAYILPCNAIGIYRRIVMCDCDSVSLRVPVGNERH